MRSPSGLLGAATLLASALVMVPEPSRAADGVGVALLGTDDYASHTVSAADGTLAMAHLRDVVGEDRLFGRVRTGSGWSDPVPLSTSGAEVHSEWDLAAAPGAGVVAFSEGDQDKVVVVRFGASGVLQRYEVSAGYTYLGGVRVAVQGDEMAVAFNDKNSAAGKPRVRAASRASGAAGFRAPRSVAAADVAEVHDLALSGDRLWLAYALKDGPNPKESFWGTYRFSVTPAEDEWHAARLFGSGAGQIRVDASAQGDVVYATSTPSAGIFTRSFDAADIPVNVPPGWYPVLRDEVHHGSGQVDDQSHHGHRVQLVRTPDGSARVLGPGGSMTTATTGVVTGPLLLADDGSAVAVRSGDGRRIDVHRGGLGQPFALAQQLGAGTSVKNLVEAGEGGGVEYVVYEDDATEVLYWWVGEDAPPEPPAPALSLGALPEWTLAPSTQVRWTSTATSAELQRQSGRSHEVTRSGWSVAADPAGSSTTVPVAPGATHCFRARSHGEGVSLGEFSAQRCTTTPVDDRSLGGSSKWKAASSSRYFNGRASWTTKKGRALTTGVRHSLAIAVVVSTCPTCGKVNVLWQGRTVKRISLRGPARDKQVIIVKRFSQPTDGTVKIQVTTSGKKVVVDGLGSRRPAG